MTYLPPDLESRPNLYLVDPEREHGPERFLRAQAGPPPPQRRSLVRALAAGLALLLVIVAIPAALIYLGAVPSVPRSLPDRQDLAQALNMQQILTVLSLVAWAAWLQFTLCFVVELLSAIRGVGLPSRIPLSGPSQSLARSLVGALLVTVAVAGPAATANAAVSSAPTKTSVATTAMAQPGEQRAAANLESSPAPRVKQGVGPKVYTVQPPDGRYHDNLWDIAEKHLGDGRRYREIHDLNLGREQNDGRKLELSRIIQPGWQLVMPEDARGLPRMQLPDPVPPAPAAPEIAKPAANPQATQVQESVSEAIAAVTGGQDAAQSQEAIASKDQSPAPSPAAVVPKANPAEASGPQSASVPEISERPKLTLIDGMAQHGVLSLGLASGGLLAAGLLVLLRRVRRRPSSPASAAEAEAEVSLRIGADLERRSALDLTLRELAADCQRAQLQLPQIFAVRTADNQVELLLAPAALVAPDGWEVLADGSCWRGPLRSEVEARTADLTTPGPFPTLVSIGRDAEERDVLLDLDAANGPVAITGDPTAVAQVGTALALSLATSPWAGDLLIAANGLSPAAAAVAPERLISLTDGAEVTAAVDALLADVLVTDQVLSGGRPDRGNQVLVLAADPGPQAVEALGQLVSAPGHRARAVLVAAEIPGATWRLRVDEAGTVEIQPLELRVSGYRLSPTELNAMAALLTTARQQGVQTPPPNITTEPGVRIDDAQLFAAPCRLSLLGTPEVRAEGPLDPSRVPLATEVVAFLATHRAGVHPTVLAGALWPRGVGAEVRDATVARVRQWLGRDSTGQELLAVLPDGRLKLSDQMPSDWDAIRTLSEQAIAVKGQSSEPELLRRALRVVRGPLLAGIPQGRYAWVARTSLEQQVSDTIISLAHRLSELRRAADPAAALAAATSGLRFAPREQVLWRDVLLAAQQAEQQIPNSGHIPAYVEQLNSVLADLGDPLEAQTAALIDELLPNLLQASS